MLETDNIQQPGYKSGSSVSVSCILGELLWSCFLSCLFFTICLLYTSASALKSGPVWFFCPKRTDRDRDQSTYFLKLKKTGPGPQKTKDRSLLQSLDQSWSEPLTTSLGPVFQLNMRRIMRL